MAMVVWWKQASCGTRVWFGLLGRKPLVSSGVVDFSQHCCLMSAVPRGDIGLLCRAAGGFFGLVCFFDFSTRNGLDHWTRYAASTTRQPPPARLNRALRRESSGWHRRPIGSRGQFIENAVWLLAGEQAFQVAACPPSTEARAATGSRCALNLGTRGRGHWPPLQQPSWLDRVRSTNPATISPRPRCTREARARPVAPGTWERQQRGSEGTLGVSAPYIVGSE